MESVVILSHVSRSSQLMVVNSYKTKQAKSFAPLPFSNFITTNLVRRCYLMLSLHVRSRNEVLHILSSKLFVIQ